MANAKGLRKKEKGKRNDKKNNFYEKWIQFLLILKF